MRSSVSWPGATVQAWDIASSLVVLMLIPLGLGLLAKARYETLADSVVGQAGQISTVGLLIGIELERPCAELVGRALEAGLLINVTAERVIRLLPPLILTDEDADLLVERLSGLIRNFVTEPIH